MNSQTFKFCPMCATPVRDATIDGTNVQRCSSCGYINWKDPKPTVSILITKDGKILLLRRAVEPFKAFWVLPGGFVPHDEEPEDAIIREAKEEIGLVPKNLKVVDANMIRNDPRGIHLNIFYEGVIDGDIILSKEHDAFEWYDVTNLPADIAYRHREVIEHWLNV